VTFRLLSSFICDDKKSQYSDGLKLRPSMKLILNGFADRHAVEGRNDQNRRQSNPGPPDRKHTVFSPRYYPARRLDDRGCLKENEDHRQRHQRKLDPESMRLECKDRGRRYEQRRRQPQAADRNHDRHRRQSQEDLVVRMKRAVSKSWVER
jgi:hypothetical protein